MATLVGGNPEVIEHGLTGFTVQPEDVSDLGMMQLFGREGAERVRQHFGIGQMVDRYRNLHVRSLTVNSSGMNKT